jgi:hypothetical protein
LTGFTLHNKVEYSGSVNIEWINSIITKEIAFEIFTRRSRR